MAIVLIEEVLMGLEDAKDSLEQAVLTLEGMTDDMHPDMGDLKAIIEQTLVQSRCSPAPPYWIPCWKRWPTPNPERRASVGVIPRYDQPGQLLHLGVERRSRDHRAQDEFGDPHRHVFIDTAQHGIRIPPRGVGLERVCRGRYAASASRSRR